MTTNGRPDNPARQARSFTHNDTIMSTTRTRLTASLIAALTTLALLASPARAQQRTLSVSDGVVYVDGHAVPAERKISLGFVTS